MKIKLIPSDMNFNLTTFQFEKEKIFYKIYHSAGNPICL